MRVKPKEILVNLPVALMFNSEEEAAAFASSINTIIHGKVKVKYDMLGRLNEQEVVLFYLQRNNEFHEIHDEFRNLIEQEEMNQTVLDLKDSEELEHALCINCSLAPRHLKGVDHCICGSSWLDGKCIYQ